MMRQRPRLESPPQLDRARKVNRYPLGESRWSAHQGDGSEVGCWIRGTGQCCWSRGIRDHRWTFCPSRDPLVPEEMKQYRLLIISVMDLRRDAVRWQDLL